MVRSLALVALWLPLAASAVAAQRTRPTAPMASAGTSPSPVHVDVAPLAKDALRWRMVGPVRGGRVTTVTGVPQQPFTFYMGSTGGGVWKTTDAGLQWRNVSDPFFACGSMGSIDVADSDPNVVYAGTGSDGIRSNVSLGCGVYRSRDAGATWQFVGLKDVGQIGAVVVHPTNPDIVWVAAIGDPFKPTPQRGIYKTTDGGATWRQVLRLSDSTGAADLELKPDDPSVVYATMWRAERKPWTIISGAHEGGFYRSADGGETWTKVTAGLPDSLVGKGDLAVSAADPKRVYLLLEAKPGAGLYRSDDAGLTWRRTSDRADLTARAFYYLNVDADPTNADVVYVSNEPFLKSTDGGATFRVAPTPHGDNHDLWINPRNPAIMVQSNDGGANVSLDGGATWTTQYNQPTAEIYQVAVDSQWPYRIYGAQQDQGATHVVPSLPPTASRVDDPLMQWHPAGGCETGPAVPNLRDPEIVYVACKGQFSRFNLRTGQEQAYWVGAQSLYGNDPKDLVYRFQRVSPLATSPHDARTIYFGSQYVHRTRDEGRTWERISPDLTANEPDKQVISGTPITRDVTGEEYYSTLYAIAESPLEPGVIWAGANDGPISVTRDGGKTWTRVTPPDLPPGGRVQTIAPSPHRRGTAYVAVLRHLLGDYRPYVYRTTDYGRTWTRLTDGANGVPADHPTRVVREDPVRPGLLYLGTEYGFFVSFDDGAHWQDLRLNLPVTPVTDLVVHRNDLVISTQGRALWILDDVTPLHALRDADTAAAVVLYRPRPAVRMRWERWDDRPDLPQVPPMGAPITYLLKAPASKVTLDILDGTGRVIRSFASDGAGAGRAAGGRRRGTALVLPTSPGMHRVTWDYSLAGPRGADGVPEPTGGPMVVPGTYRLRLTADGTTVEQPLEIRIDPRVAADGVTSADLRSQFTLAMQVQDAIGDARVLLGRLKAHRTALEAKGNNAGAWNMTRRLIEELETASGRYQSPKLIEHLQYLAGLLRAADQRPGRDAVERFALLRRQLADVKSRADAVLPPT